MKYLKIFTGLLFGVFIVSCSPPSTATLATLTTTAITSITGGTASSGGTISNNGGSAITQKGICWSTSTSPTIANSKTMNGTNIGTFNSIINGLTINTTYYVKAYATNSTGTAYGNQISFITTPTLSVGSFYQGGVIGYFLQSGDPGYSATVQHGIIISQNTIGIAEFGCYNVPYPNPFGTAIGNGNNNTINIVAGCSTSGIAAEICLNLVLNNYSDWFLPCTGEWNAINTNYLLLPVVGNYLTSNTNGALNQNVFIYTTSGGFGSAMGPFPFKAFRLF